MTATTPTPRPRLQQRLANLPDLSSPALMLTTVAVIAALTGLALVVMTAAGSQPAVALQTEAQHGSVSAWVESIEWLSHNHSEDSDQDDENDLGPDAPASASNELAVAGTGFAMPAAMMPGTPDEGFQRLQAEVSLLNRGAGAAQITPAHFTIENSAGEQWPALLGGTLVSTPLHQQHFLNTVVAFDVPDSSVEPTMYLVWNSDGTTTRFVISAEGAHH